MGEDSPQGKWQAVGYMDRLEQGVKLGTTFIASALFALAAINAGTQALPAGIAIAFGILVIGAYPVIKDRYWAMRLGREGVAVEGRIVNRLTRAGGLRHDEIVYTFGEGRSARQPVGASKIERYKVGGRVTVRHLPDKPEISRIESVQESA